MFSLKIRKAILPLTVVIIALPSSAFASIDSVSVKINTGAYIFNDDSTETRILLRFDLPKQISEAEIIFAELVIPITGYFPDASALRVQMHPLLITWDWNVSWDDMGDSLSDEISLDDGTLYTSSDKGYQKAYFDITRMVSAWKAGSITNNGLILFCSSEDLPYFKYIRDDNAPFGRVTIHYDH